VPLFPSLGVSRRSAAGYLFGRWRVITWPGISHSIRRRGQIIPALHKESGRVTLFYTHAPCNLSTIIYNKFYIIVPTHTRARGSSLMLAGLLKIARPIVSFHLAADDETQNKSGQTSLLLLFAGEVYCSTFGKGDLHKNLSRAKSCFADLNGDCEINLVHFGELKLAVPRCHLSSRFLLFK
jgi:hypothetical protein